MKEFKFELGETVYHVNDEKRLCKFFILSRITEENANGTDFSYRGRATGYDAEGRFGNTNVLYFMEEELTK